MIDWPQEERDQSARSRSAPDDYAGQSLLAQQAYEAHINFMRGIGLLSAEEAKAALAADGRTGRPGRPAV